MSFLIRIIQMFRSETDSYFSLQLPRFTPGTRFKGLLPENAHWRWGSDAFKEEKRKKNVVPITALKRRKPIKCTSRIPIPFSVIRNAYWHSNCRIGNKRKGVDGLILAFEGTMKLYWMFFLLVPITGFSLHYWCLAAPLLETPIHLLA